MIGRISGQVLEVTVNQIVVDTGGLGYVVSVPTTAAYEVGSPATIYTHLAVRENALDLYGFTTKAELEVFEMLITLPKIGPKSALQILSQADISLLKQAVANDDPSYLSKLSGIGKKSAEKIVAGLKEKFDGTEYELTAATSDNQNEQLISDTIDALVALGYPLSEARSSVQIVFKEEAEVGSVNRAVKLTLKLLS